MILLDTQVVFWSIVGSNRLGRQARALLASASGRYVSSITRVEFAIKQMKGKLRLPPDLSARLADAGLEDLAFSARHAEGLHRFPTLVTHDAFDRMLLAHARVDGLDLLTSDRTLLALEEPWIIDATR
ncbi:MAG: hypothetical protein JWQ32_1347 [Marmoricola sp.]|nr:hypothetical protein [Marmoricola sp.]